MNSISASLEWLFTEAGNTTADRIRAAAAHGLNAVEIWGWRDKNLDDVRKALDETGTTLLSTIVDPQLQITNPATHDDYLIGVSQSLDIAKQLGALGTLWWLPGRRCQVPIVPISIRRSSQCSHVRPN
ncbi:hypothetical protein [Pseudarthrobacter scleromae]|uniref:hypothetical protein n=1 Tax=Pseudarthrobacter scleromae TaxID=158897 RepID=UPI003D03C3D8